MLKLLSECFTSENVNTGRQVELDIAKGFAIIFMVFSHVYMDLSDWSNPLLTVLIYYILGGPFSAPVFMFCMGIGIGYSKKHSPKDLFIRGLRLLSYAVILDFFRYVLPASIYQSIHGTVSLKTIFLNFFGIDILQFSGLFFIFFSFLMIFHIPHWGLILIALGTSLLGQFLNGFSFSGTLSNMLASFFWRSAEYSYFPLLNWSVFPITGYLFSFYLKRCQNKDALYSAILPITTLLTAVYLIVYCIFWKNGDQYYGMGPIHAMLALACTITVISIFHTTFKKASLFVRGMCWMSSHVTSLYCVHWVIIMTIYFLFIEFSYSISSYAVIPFGLFILFISCLILRFQDKCLTRFKHT